MGVTPPYSRYHVLSKLLERNGQRYSNFYNSSSKYLNMAPVRDWFADWHLALQRELAVAINERDNVIGKQWLYDDITKRHALCHDALHYRVCHDALHYRGGNIDHQLEGVQHEPKKIV